MKACTMAVALLLGCNRTAPEEGKEPAPIPALAPNPRPAATATASSAQPMSPYTPGASVPDPIKSAIAASDRSDEDRRLDAARKPGEVLAFLGVAPGQKIGELSSGGGYTTELLARVVGDSGVVYAQNSKEQMDTGARKTLTERASKSAMKRVVIVERPIDAPFPPEAKQLDLVVMIHGYHDAVHGHSDRRAMNKAVFAALRKGGVFAILDASSSAGTGARDAGTLHRIDIDLVKKEVAAAGFKLAGESDALRNPTDSRDWDSLAGAADAPPATSDRFIVKFVK